MSQSILIVDDNAKLCHSLADNFEALGYSCSTALDSVAAMKIFESSGIDASLVDVRLGVESGVSLLERMKAVKPTVPVIMMTAYAEIANAVESIKKGAFDYVQKPIAFDQLSEVLGNAIRVSRVKESKRKKAERSETPSSARKLVTRDPTLLETLEKAERVADTDLPVLILGESGTGKELLAEFIHHRSRYRDREMIRVNCSAFQESLLDSELFGYQKGSFTGAENTFPGVFERADGSSLFLDEIGDMPAVTQTKILRTLQDSKFRRVGGTETLSTRFRLITATNKPLQTMVSTQEFREDLYYRLNTVTMELPPLRDRRDDIPLLVTNLLSQFADTAQDALRSVDTAVMDALTCHTWPGNVRELKNVVEYAAAISRSGTITLTDLPHSFTSGALAHVGSLPDCANVRERMERDLIESTLTRFARNKTRTAEYLGMTRKTLYDKIKKYGLA